MEKNCLICGSKYEKSKIVGLFECKSCGFKTANIDISDDDLKKLYSDEYFHGEEYVSYTSDRDCLQKDFLSRLDVIKRFCPRSKDKKIFEIGCAYGFFLELAKKYFDATAGIDIASSGVKYAKTKIGVEAYDGDFLNFNLCEHKDVFCLWDTIEHLRRPELFIKKISDNLNKDGLIAITTGDIGSLNARLRGKKWRQIHPPTHLHYFSKISLLALLSKYGFQVVYVEYPGLYRSLDQIAYISLVLKNKMNRLYDFLKKLGILNGYIYLNTFDYMFVIGKKI